MKKEMNLTTNRFVIYLAKGIGWLLYTFLLLWNNPICSILASFLLLICLILSISFALYPTEPDDEMSKHHLTKAKSKTLDALGLIFATLLVVFSAIALLHKFIPAVNEIINVKIDLIIPLTIGITDVMVGLLFWKYEKDGE